MIMIIVVYYKYVHSSYNVKYLHMLSSIYKYVNNLSYALDVSA